MNPTAMTSCDVHAQRINALEDHRDKVDEKLEAISGSVGQMAVALAGMKGELKGAIAASRIVGGLVGAALTLAIGVAGLLLKGG